MQAIYRSKGEMLDYTPGSDVAAGEVVPLGDTLLGVANHPIPSGHLDALVSRGVFDVVKDASDVEAYDPVYWDADGDPVGGIAGTGAFSTDATKGPFAGWSLADAGVGVGTVRVYLACRDAAVAVARAALVQDDLKPYAIPLEAFKVWDAVTSNPVSSAGNDDLALIVGTFATSAPTIQSGDAKATTISRKIRFQFPVPPEYVAGQTVTLRVNAGMLTTVSDTSATIDAEAVRQAAPNADVCATAAKSINNLVAANKDFTLTPTDVVPGDILDVVLTVAIVDGATGTAVIGKINKVELLFDVKG